MTRVVKLSPKLQKEAKLLSAKHKNDRIPLLKITTKQITKEWSKLIALDSKTLKHAPSKSISFANKYNYPGKHMFSIKSSHIGNKISNKFFQRERFKGSQNGKPSPYQVWKDDKKREVLFSSMIKLNKLSHKKNDAQLRAAMRLYYAVVPQFKVDSAKFIYDYFMSKHVLDFSAGWGDRLTGFLAAEHTQSYVGIDPNRALKKCFRNLLNFFSGFKVNSKPRDIINNESSTKTNVLNKDIQIIYKPAESSTIHKRFDTIFTSPPYFELEKYSNDKTQSNEKYKMLDEWLDKFLFATLRKYLPMLDGVLVLQISDYKKGKLRVEIVKPLMKFMKKEFPEFTYKGFITIETKGRFSNYIYEPMFVWKN